MRLKAFTFHSAATRRMRYLFYSHIIYDVLLLLLLFPFALGGEIAFIYAQIACSEISKTYIYFNFICCVCVSVCVCVGASLQLRHVF